MNGQLKRNILFFLLIIFLFLYISPLYSFPKKNNPYTINFLKNHIIPEQDLIIEKKIKEHKKYTNYLVSYHVNDIKLYSLLSIPKDKKPNKGYPVVIVNHGYIPPHQYSTENSYKLVTGYFASNGFLVLKPDYRGHDASGIGPEDTYHTRLNYALDVLYLLKNISSLDKANEDQIFIYGHSMGGDITLRILEVADNIKAASLWAPVSKLFPENFLFFWRKRSPHAADSVKKELDKIYSKNDYYSMSSINYLNLIKTPIILHHGTDDESVPYSWSTDLVKLFDRAKLNYQFLTYHGEDHNFSRRSFYKVLKRDVEFFKKYL